MPLQLLVASALLLQTLGAPTASRLDCRTGRSESFSLLLHNTESFDVQIRTCDDPNSCSGGGGRLAERRYNDCPLPLPAMASATALFDGNVTYLMFANGKASTELWPDGPGGWPSQYQVSLHGNGTQRTLSSTGLEQWFLPDDPNPALSKHCNDVAADGADAQAAEWWSANSWRYAAWGKGLCPAKYNVTNNAYHPVDGGDKVTIRRMGS